MSGWCLEGVWVTLGDSGYCLGGCNAKSIDKHSLGIILIGWFLFSQWLPISDVCRVSVGCLEDVWKCLEGVQGCLITLQGVTMLFQPINMDRESCYSSSCFSPSAIFSASVYTSVHFTTLLLDYRSMQCRTRILDVMPLV